MKMSMILVFLMTSVMALGQPVGEIQDFSATDVAGGAVVSLNQFKGDKGLVVIFRGNECPFDGYYNQRITELVRDYKGKIPIILVNPYLEAPEAEDKMKMHATVWGLGIPYLADKGQQVMDALGARKTPEAFVLKNKDGKFTVIYAGAIDDNPQLPAGVKQKHLEAAINGLLNGQTSGIQTIRATGCTIRKR
jgi:peroxiredoxin